VALFEFSTLVNPNGLRLDPSIAALRIVTCDVCTCYGHVFCACDSSGQARWHARNRKPRYLPPDASDWDPFPESPLVMSSAPRHLMAAANWLLLPDVRFSQVGGLPTWIQDAEYPTCPECSRRMAFVAQVSNEDFQLAEGIYYAFHCTGCRVGATTYQQS
jgi:hypothetical protein